MENRKFPGKEESPFKVNTNEKKRAQALQAEILNIERSRKIIKRFEQAKQKRAQFLPIWQEVSNYVLPYRGGFYEVSPNSGSVATFDKSVEIYDDTATNALVKAASALYSYTANPATQWFSFGLTMMPTNGKKPKYSVAELMQSFDVKSYLQTIASITASYINAQLSTPFHAFCQELLAFAASAFLVLEDFSDRVVNVQPVSAKDLFVLNNEYGGIGEVYRTVILTNEQAFAQFGQGLDPSVIKEVEENPLKERVFIHAVMPRQFYDPKKKDALNMPIASLWIDYQTKKIVLESGYEEFPYAVGRINVPAGCVYGFSPAMSIRHTIKSLNKLNKQRLSAGDLALNPAMNVPLDTYVNPLSLKPAALNYHEADSGRVAEPMHTIGNFQINIETIQDAREQVRQGMMIDLIEQNDKDNTYQAMQEQLLQLKLMSPWQGNLERDALRPLVIRVFNILKRRGGLLPDPPAELQAAFEEGSIGLNISYQSPLAKAQRHFDVTATERTLAFGAQLAELGGMEIINVEKAMRLYSELLGAPSEILYSEAEVRKQREEQAKQQEALAQQQQQLMMLQAMQQGAAASKDMAQAQEAGAQAEQMGAETEQGQQPMLPPGLEGMM